MALVAQRRRDLSALIPSILPARCSLVWEIGCGHGHFLTAYAAAHPKHHCVGVDISPERIARAVRKQERARLRNLHFILADAEDFLASISQGMRIRSIFILFPDPWPKRRHQKNRIIKPEFLSAVAQRAATRAPLYFRTDFEPYFRDAAEIFAAHRDWVLRKRARLPFEEPTVFQQRAPRHFTLVAARR